jgi:hypothetical protein
MTPDRVLAIRGRYSDRLGRAFRSLLRRHGVEHASALQSENTMTEVKTIADFAPDTVESGVGLALQDDEGRYLFFLAGTRHGCPPGELFYAGIGGHREEGEGWLPGC